MVDEQQKQTYEAPTLTHYGDFRSLTQQKGTVDKDGPTAPLRTRNTGGPDA
jgi:uncharacterized protein DUF5972